MNNLKESLRIAGTKHHLAIALACVVVSCLSTAASAFSTNDMVTAFNVAPQHLNIRNAPSLSGSIIGQVSEGDCGWIEAGPQQADGYTWWRVRWNRSGVPTGWSVQNYLVYDYDLQSGSPKNDSVASGRQIFYRFRVTDSAFYRVELTSLTNDADLYGHWDYTVNQVKELNNHGYSLRNNNADEHISFMSNYRGSYYVAVYGCNASSFQIRVVETPPPTVLTSVPNDAGITWHIGENQTISWNKSGTFDDFSIQISRVPVPPPQSRDFQFLVPFGQIGGSVTSWPWAVQGPVSQSCCIKVQGICYIGYSQKHSPFPNIKPWQTPLDRDPKDNQLQPFEIANAPGIHTLSINSSPVSNVPIGVSMFDRNGQGNGFTLFTRIYDSVNNVTLVAPGSFGGKTFIKWTKDGVDCSISPSVSVDTDGDHSLVAIYDITNPVYSLQINSSPDSGISIDASPQDRSGHWGGSTPFPLSYESGTIATLTAPLTAGGKNFQKWTRGGADYSTNNSIQVTVSGNYAMTAVYVTPPPVCTLTVQSSPDTGINITALPNDKDGKNSGTTNFTLRYDSGSNVTLTAPLQANGKDFQKWIRGSDEYSTNRSVSVPINQNLTMTALYGAPPHIALISPSSGSNLGPVDADITGSRFANGATIRLQKGSSIISGERVTFVSTGKLTCSFNLAGKAAGAWDLTVTNPDMLADTIAGGFVITDKNADYTNAKSKQTNTIEPINTATGAYLYSHKDLQLPGRGLPFEFARFYSSQASGATAMGAKWRHSYLVSLEQPDGNNVTIHWADGTSDYYSLQADGTYRHTYYGYSGQLTKNPDGSFDFITKALVTYQFDATGRLLSIKDRNGNALTLHYDGMDRIESITDTADRSISFTYDAANQLAKVALPGLDGRAVSFTYELDGDLATYVDTNGNTVTYSYDADHNMTHVQDRLGNTLVANDYDADDRVTSQSNGRGNAWHYLYTTEGVNTETDPLAGVTTYEYNDMSWIVKQTNPRGHYVQYEYDSEGNRVGVTNPRGTATRYGYDARGNVLSICDPTSATTRFEYNTRDQVTLIADPLGRETRFGYDEQGNLTTVTRPLNHVTSFHYDANGQMVRAVDPMGAATTYAYDGNGNRISARNALGQTTRFVYDAAGRLSELITPNGTTATVSTRFSYDAEGNLLTFVDPEDHVTSSTYDANGNRLALSDPLGHVTTFAYNPNNLAESVTDALGNPIAREYDALDRLIQLTDRRGKVSHFGYDAAGNLTSATDPTSAATSFTYDANGNRLSVLNANGHPSWFAYDALDRLSSVSDALGNQTRYDYDAAGRLVFMTDANGTTTSYAYDALDRLVQVADATSGTARYAYDLNGNRTAITDPNGNTTAFEYDALNRLVAEYDPLGRAHRYTYDAAGNLATRADARFRATAYAWTPSRRLQKVQYPDSSAVAFEYDANGARTRMTDAVGTTQWIYDELGRITLVADPFGNAVGYGYDAASNRTLIDYDAAHPGTKAVNYAFDDAGRLQSLTDWAGHAFAYHYDPAGNVTQLDYPSSATEKWTYSANERLQTLTHETSPGSPRIALSYYYDRAGNIIGMDRQEAVEREYAAELTTSTYNAANEIRTAGTDSFSFDANGNQITHTKPSGPEAGTTRFAYNMENRLTELDPPGAALSRFTYNGAGDRLVSDVGGTTTTRYLLDLNKPLTDVLAETDAANAPRQYYLYGLGLVARVTPSGELYQYHPDHLGSIMAMTNQFNTPTAAFTYDEFGAVASQTGDDAGPWLFCGAHGLASDLKTILYVRNRHYRIDQGRFLTADPFRTQPLNTQSSNRYIYVSNRPMVLVDRSGMCSEQSSEEPDTWLSTFPGLSYADMTMQPSHSGQTEYVMQQGNDTIISDCKIYGALGLGINLGVAKVSGGVKITGENVSPFVSGGPSVLGVGSYSWTQSVNPKGEVSKGNEIAVLVGTVSWSENMMTGEHRQSIGLKAPGLDIINASGGLDCRVEEYHYDYIQIKNSDTFNSTPMAIIPHYDYKVY